MTTHTPPAGMEILTPEWRENNPPHSTTIALDPRVNVWQTFTSEAHIIEAYWTDSRVLFAAPLASALCNLLEADILQYFGLVYTCTGNCSDGYVDAYIRVGKPEIPAPAMTVTSNI